MRRLYSYDLLFCRRRFLPLLLSSSSSSTPFFFSSISSSLSSSSSKNISSFVSFICLFSSSRQFSTSPSSSSLLLLPSPSPFSSVDFYQFFCRAVHHSLNDEAKLRRLIVATLNAVFEAHEDSTTPSVSVDTKEDVSSSSSFPLLDSSPTMQQELQKPQSSSCGGVFGGSKSSAYKLIVSIPSSLWRNFMKPSSSLTVIASRIAAAKTSVADFRIWSQLLAAVAPLIQQGEFEAGVMITRAGLLWEEKNGGEKRGRRTKKNQIEKKKEEEEEEVSPFPLSMDRRSGKNVTSESDEHLIDLKDEEEIEMEEEVEMEKEEEKIIRKTYDHFHSPSLTSSSHSCNKNRHDKNMEKRHEDNGNGSGSTTEAFHVDFDINENAKKTSSSSSVFLKGQTKRDRCLLRSAEDRLEMKRIIDVSSEVIEKYVEEQIMIFKSQNSSSSSSSFCTSPTSLLAYLRYSTLLPNTSTWPSILQVCRFLCLLFNSSSSSSSNLTPPALPSFSLYSSSSFPFSPSPPSFRSRSSDCRTSSSSSSPLLLTSSPFSTREVLQILDCLSRIIFVHRELIECLVIHLTSNLDHLTFSDMCLASYSLALLDYNDIKFFSSISKKIQRIEYISCLKLIRPLSLLLVAFSKLQLRDDALQSWVINSLITSMDVRQISAVSLSPTFFYAVAISVTKFRSLQIRVMKKIIPLLLQSINDVNILQPVLLWKGLIHMSIWIGPFRSLLRDRLLRELPQLRWPTLRSSLSLCGGLLGFYDSPFFFLLLHQMQLRLLESQSEIPIAVASQVQKSFFTIHWLSLTPPLPGYSFSNFPSKSNTEEEEQQPTERERKRKKEETTTTVETNKSGVSKKKKGKSSKKKQKNTEADVENIIDSSRNSQFSSSSLPISFCVSPWASLSLKALQCIDLSFFFSKTSRDVCLSSTLHEEAHSSLPLDLQNEAIFEATVGPFSIDELIPSNSYRNFISKSNLLPLPLR